MLSLRKKMVGSSKQAEQSSPLCLSISSADFLCVLLSAPKFYLIARSLATLGHPCFNTVVASSQYSHSSASTPEARQDNNFQGPCPIKSDLLEINYCARSLA